MVDFEELLQNIRMAQKSLFYIDSHYGEIEMPRVCTTLEILIRDLRVMEGYFMCMQDYGVTPKLAI